MTDLVLCFQKKTYKTETGRGGTEARRQSKRKLSGEGSTQDKGQQVSRPLLPSCPTLTSSLPACVATRGQEGHEAR